MKIQKHLKTLLENSYDYSLTDQDKKVIKNQGIEEFVLQKLSSKKFRKWSFKEGCKERTLKAIQLNTKNNKPLSVVFPMGGYKLWRIPSSPEVDWAEFFNISYLIRYLAPIIKAYKPGVTLSYYMHTLLMEKHDNLSTKEINAYINSFQKLIDSFSKHLSKNFKIKIWKDADIYPRKEYFKALEEGYNQAKKEYPKLPKEKKEHLRKLSKLNIKWKGVEDWAKLSKKGKEEKIINGALYEIAATSNLPKVMKSVKSDEKILLFSVGTPQFIGIGTTKTSMTKHWTGFGVLEKNKEKLYNRVLSPSQFEKAKKIKHSIEKVNLLPLKNFKEIWVFPKQFNFNK